ncbi:MAG: hldE 3 [Anaerosporomusa subterranea]|jgi:D-beta-D-heptose 7-phosphate kinase/D-beta-D-heptose 1-phosphate adenosyltransferase|nr:hldE 3 [Anaerosporomusa subterranea]
MFKDCDTVIEFLEHKARGIRVLVVGDVMLDRYYSGDVRRISPEAPIPVVSVKGERDILGGAANVSLNLLQLGCGVKLVGVVGDDDNRKRLLSIMKETGMDDAGLITDDRPTTTKLRVISGQQQMLRLDFETTRAISRKPEQRINTYIETELERGLDGIIISDYAKGVCTTAVCKFAIAQAAARHIPVLVDPKGANWKKYAGALYIKPNIKELEDVLCKRVVNENNAVERAGVRVKNRFNIDSLILTRSEKGLSLVTGDKTIHVPALCRDVFDVSGAGDTVIATMGAALFGGIEKIDAILLANLAASIVIGKVGTYAIHARELLEAVCAKRGTNLNWQEVAHQ